MDVFKLAFETTIVGLLALPWLALLLRIFVPELDLSNAKGGMSLSFVSEKLEATTLTILVVAAVYFLGSAISPLSTQLLDDQDIPFFKIRAIRASAYQRYSDDLSKLGPSSNAAYGPLYNALAELTSKCKSKNDPSASPAVRKAATKDCWKRVDNVFLLQEQTVFKQGSDKTERVSRLFERAVVLRGAVFNGFAFVVLCCFSYLARASNEPFRTSWENSEMKVRTLMLIAVFVPLLCMGLYWGLQDYHLHDASDPPIMECGLITLGGVGICTFVKGVVKRPHLGMLLIGFILTLLAYGSWAWTEFLYAKNVIGAFYAP